MIILPIHSLALSALWLFPFRIGCWFYCAALQFSSPVYATASRSSLQRKSHERDYRADGSKRMYIVTFREALYIPAFVRFTNGCHSLSSLFYTHGTLWRCSSGARIWRILISNERITTNTTLKYRSNKHTDARTRIAAVALGALFVLTWRENRF